MPSLINDTISDYMRRDDVVPLGQPGENISLELGAWRLSYHHNTQTWHCRAGNVDLVATTDVDRADLTILLEAFDRVASNTLAMHQPRRIVMEVGFPLPHDTWVSADKTSSSIRWGTTYNGIVPVVAIDNPNHISDLDRVICHEITHLMEPDLSDLVEQLTQLLLAARFNRQESIMPDISLTEDHAAALVSINPEYFTLKLNDWGRSMSCYESRYSAHFFSSDEYHGRTYKESQALATEIVFESSMWRFLGRDHIPSIRRLWPELDRIIFLPAISESGTSNAHGHPRLSRYELESFELPPCSARYRAAPFPVGFISDYHSELRRRRELWNQRHIELRVS